MRIESREEYDARFSRRKFLVLAGIGSAWLLSKLYYDTIPRYWPSTPEARNVDSKMVFPGVCAISKGINIRTSPKIPNRTRFRSPNNRLDWDEIGTINGTWLKDRTVFLVVNPTAIVEGKELMENVGSYWARFMIKVKDGSEAQPFYINFSHSTEEVVKFLGFAGYTGFPETYDNHKLGVKGGDSNEVGRIIIPENSETMARDFMPGLWAERMRKKFEGNLDPNDQIVTDVQVVGSDQLINVREYPSLEYGNGEPVNIVGT